MHRLHGTHPPIILQAEPHCIMYTVPFPGRGRIRICSFLQEESYYLLILGLVMKQH